MNPSLIFLWFILMCYCSLKCLIALRICIARQDTYNHHNPPIIQEANIRPNVNLRLPERTVYISQSI